MKTLTKRFWKKVKRTPSGCWEWIGSKTVFGYGQVRADDNGPLLLAHRVSFEIHRGEIPEKMCVLHRCDSAACVNPSHLFLGTKADNSRDMHAKGRARHPVGWILRKKFDEQDILQIRRLAAAGFSRAKIARMFSTSGGHVSHIVNRKFWRHI